MASSGQRKGGSCCRCNRTGTCQKCSCAKAGRPCVKCLPGILGKCLNQHVSQSPQLPPSNLPSPATMSPSTLSTLSSSAPSTTCTSAANNSPASTLCLPRPPPLPSASPPTPSLPPWSSIFSSRSSTLHHVPEGARDAWAGLIYDTFSNINRDPSITENWRKLFMLPRCILANPPNGGRQPWRETLKTVRARIGKWQSGDILGLWSDFVAAEKISQLCRKPKKHLHPDPNVLRASNIRRAKRAVEAGQYRKGLQALSSDGLAPASSEVLDEMLTKHPQSLPPTPSSLPPPPITINEAAVTSALRSFPGDSAPGPSLFRANHFKEAVFCPCPDRGNKALLAVTATVNHLCSGRAPPEVIPHLCGATLLACLKKGGGHRPIAVGEVLRRLTSKCLSRSVQEDALRVLTPLQLGVGVKVGCETIVHSVSRTLDDHSLSPDPCWTLLLDFSNAFNSISRACMFEEVRACIPGLAAWVESCYGAEPLLHFGDHTILSRCGVQQGDPLGPLHPVVERIKREVPHLLISAWYLDDGNLCGNPDDLLRALKIVEEDGPARGLNLNRLKSLLHIPDDADVSHNPLHAEIPISRSGSPVGPIPFCESTVMTRVEKIRFLIDRLHDLEDSQMETTLLRSCLAMPKFNFALRSCPPSYIRPATSAFDALMRECLSDLAGGPLSDWAWLKASLPSSLGGLNIRSANLHAPAAYISSLAQSGHLIAEIMGRPSTPSTHLADAVSELASAAEMPAWVSVDDIDVPLHQRSLSRSIDEASYNSLLASAPDTRSRALALSTALPHAGDWLNVVPSSALGLHLHDREFRLCMDYWLGLRMSGGASRCPLCVGERAADPLGDHQVGCGGNGDRIHRHDTLRETLFTAAQTAALAPRRCHP